MFFLRTTDKDGKSHGDFQWPMEIGATAIAPDWEPTETCGRGLHGLRDGLGDAGYLDFSADALWWIVEAQDAIDLGGKYKFKSCKVIAFGERAFITARMHALRPGPIHGLCLTGGDYSKLAGGDYSKLTGGDASKLAGGDESKLTGGYASKLTGGYASKLAGGDYSSLTGGYCSTLTGGDESTLTGGAYSTLTGGVRSTLTGGDCSTLTGGDCSTLVFHRWMGSHTRVLVAYVGEGGCKSGVTYRANADHTDIEEVQVATC